MNKHDSVVVRDLLLAWTTLSTLTRSRLRLLLGLELSDEHVCRLDTTSLAATLNLTESDAAEIKRLADPDVASKLVRTWTQPTLTIVDEAYPQCLRATADPPLVLFYEGDESILQMTAVAVVGSRKASPYGINVAEMLGRRLASSGIAVVSGLAWGIDAAAHRSALETGRTIAVLGTGLDVFYPRSNRQLQKRIADRGIVLSEFPPGTKPQPHHFPVRNRIIAGLSRAVVIVEATKKSGSLITARLAAEEGREVLAVPGSIFSDGSDGAHRLIQDGAKLVRDVDDILSEIPGFSTEASSEKRSAMPDNPDLARVCKAVLPDQPIHPDFLAEYADTPGKLCEILLELELGGWIRKVRGGAYVRVAR